VVYGSQASDGARAHACLFTDFASGSRGRLFFIFDAALREHPAVACPAGFDKQITRAVARQLENDAACMRRAAQCASTSAKCTESRDSEKVELVITTLKSGPHA
jgi:hypothetical protein